MKITDMNIENKRQFLRTALSRGIKAAWQEINQVYVIAIGSDEELYDPATNKKLTEKQAKRMGQTVVFMNETELEG